MLLFSYKGYITNNEDMFVDVVELSQNPVKLMKSF